MKTAHSQVQGQTAQNKTACEGTAPIHKHGNHPVMQQAKQNQATDTASVQINAADHVHHGAEMLDTTTEIQEGVIVVTQEVDGEGNVLSESTTLVGATEKLEDKVHWGVVGLVGGAIGAAANFDRGLIAMVAGGAAAGVTAAAVSHYREDYSLVSGLVAATAVGAGVRFLSPYLLSKNDVDNENTSVATFAQPEESAFA